MHESLGFKCSDNTFSQLDTCMLHLSEELRKCQRSVIPVPLAVVSDRINGQKSEISEI